MCKAYKNDFVGVKTFRDSTIRKVFLARQKFLRRKKRLPRVGPAFDFRRISLRTRRCSRCTPSRGSPSTPEFPLYPAI